MQTYIRPVLPAGTEVLPLAPDHLAGAVELMPETIVTVINRHPTRAYHDKYDGINYTIPGGAYGELRYDAASHFRDRSVVPGSRNPETHKEDHFIQILNMDPPERCVVFTPEHAAKIDALPEALDRSANPDAFTVMQTSAGYAAIAAVSGLKPVQEATDESVRQPPKGGEAARMSKTGRLERIRG